MRHENAQDPRRVLIDQSYFGMRPQPLEQYVYSLKLPQIAERVFWLHWDVGCRRGDFTSELSRRYVAEYVRADESSVKRAYDRLKRVGLIRRIDPGPDPENPFQRATMVTEVLLPKEALAPLLGAARRAKPATRASAVAPPTITAATHATDEGPRASAGTIDALMLWQNASETLRATLPLSDFTTWIRPLTARVDGAEFLLEAPNAPAAARILSEFGKPIRQALVAHGYTGAVRVKTLRNTPPCHPPSTENPSTVMHPRRLSRGDCALLRHRISAAVPTDQLNNRFREAVWSIESGSFRSAPTAKAIHAVAKLMAESRWTRPRQMPSRWQWGIAA
jgi:hypothetical protein